MRKLYTALSFITVLAVTACNPAYAQVACGPTEGVHDILTEEYGEAPVATKVEGGIQYEFWVNEDTGTFSVLGYPEDGVACLIDGGIIDTGVSA